MKPKIIFKTLVSIASTATIAIVLINAKIVSKSIINGLNICLNVLIPSMFLFLIISDIFQKTNALKFVLKPFEPIFAKLFKVKENLTSTLVFSLICGYPAGAYLISNLLDEKQISKKTATRLLCFCVNSGPAFLIGAISIPLTGNILYGIFLFISQITAFFVVGTLCSLRKKTDRIQIKQPKKTNIAQVFVESVNKSIKTMAIICGFCLLFSAIIGLIFETNFLNFLNPIDQTKKALISGFLEVTNGILTFQKIENLNVFLAIALITSFGGLCVHCQLKAILAKHKISFKKFYAWRIIYCLISVFVCFLLFKATKLCATTIAISNIKPKISTNSIIPSFGLIILSITLLCCDKKNTIIK